MTCPCGNPTDNDGQLCEDCACRALLDPWGVPPEHLDTFGRPMDPDPAESWEPAEGNLSRWRREQGELGDYLRDERKDRDNH